MAARETNRPYAYPGNVMDVLNRYRQLDLPASFEPTDLSTAGVPEGNHGRTVFALKFLNLLNEASEPTTEWRALCDAGDEEFRSQLGALVRAAYFDVFARIDPERDGQDRIKQAFQPYTPKSQIDRMVVFFLGMCREGGIASLDAPKRRPTKAQAHVVKSGKVTLRGSAMMSAKGTVRRNGTQPESALLFGITDADVALLGDKDFNEVWAALGKVARARARKTVTGSAVVAEAVEDDAPDA